MAVKIENQYSGKLPRNTLANLESALESVPREHLRGIERLRLVDVITEPRARMAAKGQELPALYHPRQGNQRKVSLVYPFRSHLRLLHSINPGDGVYG